MTVITQKFIFRSDLRENPHVLYLFGDNLARSGLGGQAKEMRGEPNAVGVATKRNPGLFIEDFFYDKDLILIQRTIANDLRRAFDHVKKGGIVVIPADGLGTGLSRMPEFAPVAFKFLEDSLNLLK